MNRGSIRVSQPDPTSRANAAQTGIGAMKAIAFMVTHYRQRSDVLIDNFFGCIEILNTHCGHIP
jgi:hypothetical protein